MFISSGFLLVLQVYLAQITYQYQEYQSQIDYSRAQIMAEIILQENKLANQEKVNYNWGTASYHLKGNKRQVTVTFKNSRSYHFIYQAKDVAKTN
ncbi:competence type IV pilus minor pilin ComGG [Streptococcus ictaluri]|uniref:competence type IV pilus minor pilin ComGG n=1 Tax=Streptococcus ictaluri TaxID=380397 RepID=UPI0013897B15|nr:competence type IV pilus minor pilin ComGG [Streptococcus ictaluri]